MHKVSVKNFLLLGLVVISLAMSVYNAVLAQEDESAESGPFRGFAKYKTEFKSLCDALEKDGRRLLVLDIVKTDPDINSACYACKPLFQAIESACRSALIKKAIKKKAQPKKSTEEAAAEEESTPTPSPTPIPIYRERDPNLAVLQSTLAIFSGLASDAQTVEPTYEAVLYLKSVLLADEGLSIGAEDYLETFCEYLLAPYAAYADKLEREERQLKKREEERKRKIDVDALLDF